MMLKIIWMKSNLSITKFPTRNPQELKSHLPSPRKQRFPPPAQLAQAFSKTLESLILMSTRKQRIPVKIRTNKKMNLR